MSVQTIVGIITPIVIAISMWGVGLSLSWKDFIKIKEKPRIIIFGMAVQLILVPLLAFFLNWAFGLPSPLAIGLVLLASTPGGATANILSYLSKGNVALNIGLTVINTLIGIFWVPTMVFLAYKIYEDQETAIPLQSSKLFQVLAFLIVPIALGIFTKTKFPPMAAKLEKYVGMVSFAALIFLLAAGFISDDGRSAPFFLIAGPAVIVFNIGCLTFGMVTAKLMKLNRADNSALTMELAIHNCILALGIAISPQLLNSVTVAVPAALYAVCMYITALPLAYWFRTRQHE